ncbi:hypothetical protein SGPA1_40375 [Streptomyces misionensis JCM 4497]
MGRRGRADRGPGAGAAGSLPRARVDDAGLRCGQAAGPDALRGLDRRPRDGVRDPTGRGPLATLALRAVQRRDARTARRAPPAAGPDPADGRVHRRYVLLRRGADRTRTGARHRRRVDRHGGSGARSAVHGRPAGPGRAAAACGTRGAVRQPRLDRGDGPAGPPAAGCAHPGHGRRRTPRVVRRPRSAPDHRDDRGGAGTEPRRPHRGASTGPVRLRLHTPQAQPGKGDDDREHPLNDHGAGNPRVTGRT